MYLYFRDFEKMKPRSINIFWHVTVCLAFLALPLLLSPRPAHAPLFDVPMVRDFLANGIILLLFYLNYYLLIPKLYFQDRSITYALCIVAGFFAVAFIPSALTGFVPWGTDSLQPPIHGDLVPPGPGSPSSPPADFLVHVKHNIILYVAIVMFSVLLRVRTKLFNTELQRQRAEIGTLKNQINPHFLFNTLNNIYAYAIREKSQITASSILKLSGMMRYVVTETSKDFVELEKEIGYLDDYIDLQKMRLTNSLELSYTITGNLANKVIAPMVLIPFIENAFKHGVNPDHESYISIRMEVVENRFEMVIENQKVRGTPEKHTQSGVGIENTKARLDLFYPNKYRLAINNEVDHYRVKLSLELS